LLLERESNRPGANQINTRARLNLGSMVRKREAPAPRAQMTCLLAQPVAGFLGAALCARREMDGRASCASIAINQLIHKSSRP